MDFILQYVQRPGRSVRSSLKVFATNSTLQEKCGSLSDSEYMLAYIKNLYILWGKSMFRLLELLYITAKSFAYVLPVTRFSLTSLILKF